MAKKPRNPKTDPARVAPNAKARRQQAEMRLGGTCIVTVPAVPLNPPEPIRRSKKSSK
jgi:hypothetical protein